LKSTERREGICGDNFLMATQHFHVLLEWDSEADAWVTYVPTLNGLSTFGETKEEALGNTREAILGYLEAAEKEGLPLPAPAELIDLEVAVG
jgi:predicted RNase H-like HicB family nuclease